MKKLKHLSFFSFVLFLALCMIPGLERSALAGDEAVMRPITGSRAPANSYLLELNGIVVGKIKAFEGGGPTADILLDSGSGLKRVGDTKYEDLVITFSPMMMAKPLYDWINATIAATDFRRNGAIVISDAAGNVTRRFEFSYGIISGFEMPKLDASQKGELFFKLTISPESTSLVKGSGKTETPNASNEKMFLADFTLTIDGVDTSKVVSIEPWGFSQEIITDTNHAKHPGQMKIGDLTVKENSLTEGFDRWTNDFLINGNNLDSSTRKSGSLTLLSRNGGNVLIAISFSRIGVSKRSLATAADGTLRYETGMFMDGMNLEAAQ